MKILYTDLDSLFDTRLGTLQSLDPEAVRELVRKDEYWDRERDDWPALTEGKITQEVFSEAWAKRNITTLQQSMGTQLFLVITQIFGDFHLVNREGLVESGLRLEVNTYPYDLTSDEAEVLTEVLKELLYEGLVVTFIHTPMKEVTPEFLFRRYSGALMYDFIPWIKVHCWELGRYKGREFNLIVPRLFERDASNLTLDEKKKEFFTFKLWLLEHIDIDFIEPKYFSMIPPEALKGSPADEEPSVTTPSSGS